LQWVHKSSTTGVTTIRSAKNTIIIIYDPKNESLVEFFRNLQISLEPGMFDITDKFLFTTEKMVLSR
jgi:hypothetical protein